MSKIKGSGNLDKAFEELQQMLLDFGDLAADIMSEEAEAAGKKYAKQLKSVSPVGSSKRKKYKSGWSVKVENGRGSRLRVKRVVIYNKNKPGLAHLLENGHANRDGGRTDGNPHIKPMEEACVKEYVENVKRRLEHDT